MIKYYQCILLSGIITFIGLSLTVTIGILHLNYNVHHAMGITTMVFACIHAILVFYKHFKLKKGIR